MRGIATKTLKSLEMNTSLTIRLYSSPNKPNGWAARR